MSDKLIILTDLGSFKAYRVTKDELTQKPHIQLVENFEPVDSHTRIVDKVTDLAGRFPSGGPMPAGQMAQGENHNLRSEIQRRVIKLLSQSINSIVDREQPAFWYFAANREIDQRILDGVEPSVRAKLQKHVRSDLTKIDKNDLLNYFA